MQSYHRAIIFRGISEEHNSNLRALRQTKKPQVNFKVKSFIVILLVTLKTAIMKRMTNNLTEL